MEYKYIDGPIMIGEFDVAAIFDNIISFIVALVKFEVPALKEILK